MEMKQIKSIIRLHVETINKVCDLLEEEGILPEEGEILLAHLTGLSAGTRQASLTDGIIQTLASSWEWVIENDPS